MWPFCLRMSSREWSATAKWIFYIAVCLHFTTQLYGVVAQTTEAKANLLANAFVWRCARSTRPRRAPFIRQHSTAQGNSVYTFWGHLGLSIRCHDKVWWTLRKKKCKSSSDARRAIGGGFPTYFPKTFFLNIFDYVLVCVEYVRCCTKLDELQPSSAYERRSF